MTASLAAAQIGLLAALIGIHAQTDVFLAPRYRIFTSGANNAGQLGAFDSNQV